MPKKTLPQPEAEEPYFVSVKNPLEFRRQLLESSKKTIYCLQNFQRVIIVRENKLRAMGALKDSIKELSYLNKKFNQKLPAYYELMKEKKAEAEAKGSVPLPKPVAPKIAKPVKDKTELEKLEDSLAAIEGKLKTLNTQ